MSALDHGWNPPGKHPSKKVAHEFHKADKQMGKWEHAMGGPVSPLSSILGSPGLSGGFGNPAAVHHLGGSPDMYQGMAHMRMPRIPIEGTLRNIDQKIAGPKFNAGKVANKVHADNFLKVKGMAKGGAVGHTPVHAALEELAQLVQSKQAPQRLAGGGELVDKGRRGLLKLLAASAAAVPAAKVALQHSAPEVQKAASPLTQVATQVTKPKSAEEIHSLLSEAKMHLFGGSEDPDFASAHNALMQVPGSENAIKGLKKWQDFYEGPQGEEWAEGDQGAETRHRQLHDRLNDRIDELGEDHGTPEVPYPGEEMEYTPRKESGTNSMDYLQKGPRSIEVHEDDLLPHLENHLETINDRYGSWMNPELIGTKDAQSNLPDLTSQSPAFSNWLAERGLAYDPANRVFHYDPDKEKEIKDMAYQIQEDYGSGNKDPRGPWKKFDLRGDDDVDYSGSHVEDAVDKLGHYHSTHYADPTQALIDQGNEKLVD